MQIIELTEYQPTLIQRQQLPLALGEWLWQTYDQQGGRLLVEFPSPKTDQQWRLTAQGWVGQIPVTPDLTLSLKPKVSLQNLFGMWRYAYRLNSFHWLDSIAHVDSLADFYEQLALVLAQGVLRRAKQGFFRAYVAQTGKLPFLRGQLQTAALAKRPFPTTFPCRYDTQTADLLHNQILATTLHQIARSGVCGERVGTAVRRAYRILQATTTPTVIQPHVLNTLVYNRLNQDYRPLHAICRFFLEQRSPSHEVGKWEIRPFLVNMARLYELFVAEWLVAHLPDGWHVVPQESLTLGSQDELRFDIDLVLYDAAGSAKMVLDTKYKTPDKPANPDFSQVVTYAHARGVQHAALIYPTPLSTPLAVRLGDLNIYSLTFAVNKPIEEAGQQFLTSLWTKMG
ncbi:MAG: restriction endonuclease [Chloroflexota bacterium]